MAQKLSLHSVEVARIQANQVPSPTTAAAAPVVAETGTEYCVLVIVTVIVTVVVASRRG